MTCADVGQALPIVIPTITEDGRQSFVRSTIGPASQLSGAQILYEDYPG